MKNIEDDLRKAGIDPGIWQELKMKPPKSLKDMTHLLEKLKGVLQHQLSADQETVIHMKELQNRMQYGGGK